MRTLVSRSGASLKHGLFNAGSVAGYLILLPICLLVVGLGCAAVSIAMGFVVSAVFGA